jgi:DNA-directed RNA polymerase subunit L
VTSIDKVLKRGDEVKKTEYRLLHQHRISPLHFEVLLYLLLNPSYWNAKVVKNAVKKIEKEAE